LLIVEKIIKMKIRISMTSRHKTKKIISIAKLKKHLERILKRIRVNIFLPRDRHSINIKMSLNLNHVQI
jgi:hypothetical protein